MPYTLSQTRWNPCESKPVFLIHQAFQDGRAPADWPPARLLRLVSHTRRSKGAYFHLPAALWLARGPRYSPRGTWGTVALPPPSVTALRVRSPVVVSQPGASWSCWTASQPVEKSRGVESTEWTAGKTRSGLLAWLLRGSAVSPPPSRSPARLSSTLVTKRLARMRVVSDVRHRGVSSNDRRRTSARPEMSLASTCRWLFARPPTDISRVHLTELSKTVPHGTKAQ